MKRQKNNPYAIAVAFLIGYLATQVPAVALILAWVLGPVAVVLALVLFYLMWKVYIAK